MNYFTRIRISVRVICSRIIHYVFAFVPFFPLLRLIQTFFIEIIDQKGYRNPNGGGEQYDRANDIISQKEQQFINVDLFDDIPKSFDNILNSFFANSLQFDVMKVTLFSHT